MGPDAVRFAWVKAHAGTQGNEKADKLAKEGEDEGEGMEKVITEGGPEAGVEAEEGGGEEGEGDGNGESSTVESQGSAQLRPLQHW